MAIKSLFLWYHEVSKWVNVLAPGLCTSCCPHIRLSTCVHVPTGQEERIRVFWVNINSALYLSAYSNVRSTLYKSGSHTNVKHF